MFVRDEIMFVGCERMYVRCARMFVGYGLRVIVDRERMFYGVRVFVV